MKQARRRPAAPVMPRPRDLASAERAIQSVAATREPELRRVLRHAASRQLGRLVPAATAARQLERAPAAPVAPRFERVASAAPAVRDHSSAQRHAATERRIDSDELLLRRRRELTPDLLMLEIDRPAGFDYRPGQHVKMGVGGLMRSYSLVSAPHQPRLEFFVALYRGGRLSERLRALRQGAAMALGKRPRGRLTIHADRPNQLLTATGTGIAPYISMLRHHTRSGTPTQRFVVLHGASHADELGYADELTRLARRFPQHVIYLPTVSQPQTPRSAGWQGATGRVEAQLSGVLQRHGLTPANTAAFACGNPGMTRNVADALRRDGYPVQTEPFD